MFSKSFFNRCFERELYLLSCVMQLSAAMIVAARRGRVVFVFDSFFFPATVLYCIADHTHEPCHAVRLHGQSVNMLYTSCHSTVVVLPSDDEDDDVDDLDDDEGDDDSSSVSVRNKFSNRTRAKANSASVAAVKTRRKKAGRLCRMDAPGVNKSPYVRMSFIYKARSGSCARGDTLAKNLDKSSHTNKPAVGGKYGTWYWSKILVIWIDRDRNRA